MDFLGRCVRVWMKRGGLLRSYAASWRGKERSWGHNWKMPPMRSEVKLHSLNVCFLPDEIYQIIHNIDCNMWSESEKFLCSQICRLQSAIQQQDKKEKVAPEAAASCEPQGSRLEKELHQTRSRLARMQEEAERQRERQQREIASLRADKHRLEEKVLEQSRLNTERSLLDQSQRHTEDRIR